MPGYISRRFFPKYEQRSGGRHRTALGTQRVIPDTHAQRGIDQRTSLSQQQMLVDPTERCTRDVFGHRRVDFRLPALEIEHHHAVVGAQGDPAAVRMEHRARRQRPRQRNVSYRGTVEGKAIRDAGAGGDSQQCSSRAQGRQLLAADLLDAVDVISRREVPHIQLIVHDGRHMLAIQDMHHFHLGFEARRVDARQFAAMDLTRFAGSQVREDNQIATALNPSKPLTSTDQSRAT